MKFVMCPRLRMEILVRGEAAGARHATSDPRKDRGERERNKKLEATSFDGLYAFIYKYSFLSVANGKIRNIKQFRQKSPHGALIFGFGCFLPPPHTVN